MLTHFSAALRAYVSGSILTTAYIAATDPYSQHRFAMSEDGYGGFIAITLLGCIALAGLLDVLINDVLPARFSIRCTHRHRHVIFMALAVGQVALILALVKADDLKPSAVRYTLDAVFAAGIAVAGVIAHYRSEREARLERISQKAELS